MAVPVRWLPGDERHVQALPEGCGAARSQIRRPSVLHRLATSLLKRARRFCALAGADPPSCPAAAGEAGLGGGCRNGGTAGGGPCCASAKPDVRTNRTRLRARKRIMWSCGRRESIALLCRCRHLGAIHSRQAARRPEAASSASMMTTSRTALRRTSAFSQSPLNKSF